MKYAEMMTSEKIENNTYMIWVENGSGFGPCSLYAGTWFWSKNFEKIKTFVKETSVLLGLQSITDIDEEDYEMSFADLVNKYCNDLEILNNKKSSFVNTVKRLLSKEEKNITELNITLYKLVKEFRKLDGEINAYIFDSPYSARALVESHMETQLDDFDKNFNKYFNEDIL